MKDLILYIAQALVDLPEEVVVNQVEEDLGKVIGKEGKTARAMRVILNAAATKLRKRAVLEILE
jgi:uncharacterized protein